MPGKHKMASLKTEKNTFILTAYNGLIQYPCTPKNRNIELHYTQIKLDIVLSALAAWLFQSKATVLGLKIGTK